MSIVDIAIIVIIGLTALLGLLNGAFKSIVSLLGWVLSFLAAYFLAHMVAVALLDVEFVANLVCGPSGSLYALLSKYLPESFAQSGGILETLFKPMFKAAEANALVASGAVGQSSAAILLIAFSLFTAMVCLALFAAIRVVMMILGAIVRSFSKRISMPKGASRLVGFVVGGAKGACYVFIIFVFVAVLTVFPFMGFALDRIYGNHEKGIVESSIGRPMFEFASRFSVDQMLGGDNMGDTLDKLLEKADLGEAEPASPADRINGLLKGGNSLLYRFNGASDGASFDGAYRLSWEDLPIDYSAYNETYVDPLFERFDALAGEAAGLTEARQEKLLSELNAPNGKLYIATKDYLGALKKFKGEARGADGNPDWDALEDAVESFGEAWEAVLTELGIVTGELENQGDGF